MLWLWLRRWSGHPSMWGLVVWSPVPWVYIGKTMNSTLLPVALPSECVCAYEWLLPLMSRWRLAWPGLHCLRCTNVCMNGWMLTYVVKSFQQSIRLEKRYINTVHFPFNIIFSFIEDDAQIKRNIFFKLGINAFCFIGQYMCLMLTFSPDYEEQSTTFCRLSSPNSVSKLADIFTCHPHTQNAQFILSAV